MPVDGRHGAYQVPSRAAVVDAHAAALELACVEVHAPRSWPEYPPPYFTSFFTDRSGFLLEAVCHHDR